MSEMLSGAEILCRALVHALNKADHADGLETAALSSSYFWGV